MTNSSGKWMTLVGRALVSVIFIVSGIEKLAAFSAVAGFIASKGVPLPSVATAVVVIIEVLGGIALLFGFQTRIASWVLFLYLIPTTLIVHNFWAVQGSQRMDDQVHFLKNLAIMGGLLILAANSAGGFGASAPREKSA